MIKRGSPLVLAAVVGAVTALLPSRSPAQTAASDPAAAALFSQAQQDARIGSASSAAPLLVPEPTPLSLRLEIWSDLFSPGEQAVLKTSSEALSAVRVMARVESGSASLHASELSRGPDSAAAISTALVYGGGGADAWSAPVSWGQPGTSLGKAFSQKLIPMGSDFAARSRAIEAPGSRSSVTAFFEEAVAIMPSPQGGTSVQAGTAVARLGAISLLSGDWPNFGRMTAADCTRFCKVWIKRTLNAAISTEIGELMTPRGLDGLSEGRRVAAERSRASLPIASFHFAF